ncbi:hypothetical protein IscW_ISCW010437 [Ixodes scapularis]|uniref:Uncharacterized protein n=1 Tax=Ixodes scapularis TaxID=6945 RepID=B7Q9Q4_IXOSC|nr:hypothetical protein IscW_ISCW010437 [Ixodes scapularis]|eukprot:XP_002406261.1 hypothetical protein IscW_ISCW010437 [Ixodes scapularis]
MAAAPSTSLAQKTRSEAAAACAVPGPVALEPSHRAPIGKMATEVSKDVVHNKATETPSAPAGPAQREDTVVSRDVDHSNAMYVETGSAKRALEDPPPGARKTPLRRLECEWCGKIEHFKT